MVIFVLEKLDCFFSFVECLNLWVLLCVELCNLRLKMLKKVFLGDYVKFGNRILKDN